MNFLENILNFITDSNKRLSAKTAIVILTLLSVIVIDNVTGFSYYYNNQRKLDQLESIKNLLKDTTLTTETKQKLTVIQSKVFERKNIFDYSLSFFRNISLTSSKNNQTTIKSKGSIIRNDIWFLMSTSGFYILVTILVVPILLFTDKKTPFWKLLASMIMFVIVMFFSSWFMYWLLDKIIPDELFGSWTWNYIINFIIQVGLVAGMYFATKTMNKIST